MRILGVDPGTHNTGIGVVESQGNQYRLIFEGVVKIPSALPIAKKLTRIHAALREAIGEYRPEAVALEKMFYHKDFRAVVRVGEARACAMLAASELCRSSILPGAGSPLPAGRSNGWRWPTVIPGFRPAWRRCTTPSEMRRLWAA